MDGRYVAFDVETPNRYNSRMSAIGISIIEDGRIVDEFYSLVNPEQRFDWFNTQLTGISARSVADAPTFPQLWDRIEPLLSSGVLVAHNAGFDMNVLRRCLNDYGIPWRTTAKGLCTVIMGRSLLPGIGHKLNELCDYFGIELDHHRADSDSHACAEILLRYMKMGADPARYIRNYRMCE